MAPHACGFAAALPRMGEQFAPWRLEWTPTLAASPLRCPRWGSNSRLGTARWREWPVAKRQDPGHNHRLSAAVSRSYELASIRGLLPGLESRLREPLRPAGSPRRGPKLAA